MAYAGVSAAGMNVDDNADDNPAQQIRTAANRSDYNCGETWYTALHANALEPG